MLKLRVQYYEEVLRKNIWFSIKSVCVWKFLTLRKVSKMWNIMITKKFKVTGFRYFLCEKVSMEQSVWKFVKVLVLWKRVFLTLRRFLWKKKILDLVEFSEWLFWNLRKLENSVTLILRKVLAEMWFLMSFIFASRSYWEAALSVRFSEERRKMTMAD